MIQAKIKDSVSTPDSYLSYKLTSPSPVGKKEYINIVNLFFKFLIQLILSGKEVKLPNGAGIVQIIGRKKRVQLDEKGNIIKAAPDWVKTKRLWANNPQAKEEGKVIYHLNEHTNGVRYKIHWNKQNVIYENQTLYSLRFTRTNKRDTHKEIISGKEYYIKGAYNGKDTQRSEIKG